ncbi:hypothetical protein Syun_017819 [Stephania yunnanensis]|uniref:ENT domain-containing protein n=1 Tax=Stephania yunnanensis TaxID=152371 RepID=A0AAP0P2S5_9MAGN
MKLMQDFTSNFMSIAGGRECRIGSLGRLSESIAAESAGESVPLRVFARIVGVSAPEKNRSEGFSWGVVAMDYELSDSSGTDDDLPPSHHNRVQRVGRVAGNGRSAGLGSVPYSRTHNDMETQIHLIEQEAYGSVLRAFKAQSDAITWEKEGLMTELRKELRISDDENRELLSRVNADDIIRRIREWRQAGGGIQASMHNASQPAHDRLPSPTVSISRKKQKTAQNSLSLNASNSVLHTQPVAGSMQPSSSAAKRGSAIGAKGKKSKSGQVLHSVPSLKSIQYPPSGPGGRGPVASRGSSGALVGNEPAEPGTYDLVGRKVKTRWPDDQNFYDAVITDYNPVEGRHALHYDIGTANETMEWVNLKEIPPEDIKWVGEDPGIHRGDPNGLGRGVKKLIGRGNTLPSAGRGEEARRVERVFNATHPDPLEIEKAKKALKEHEQALVDAIARLADASDGESDEGGHTYSHGQSMNREHGWLKRRAHAYENGMGEVRGDGSDGEQMNRDGGVASEGQHDGEDGDDDI